MLRRSRAEMINEKQEELIHGIIPTMLRIFLLFSGDAKETKTSCKHEQPLKIREKLL